MKNWWQRLDETPSDKRTVKEFLDERNFNWKILSLPCYMEVDGKFVRIPNHQISARSDTKRAISVVKGRLHLLDNEECFSIGNLFLEEFPSAKFVSCGDIMDEKESYLLILLKKEVVCGDEFGFWLTISNGFDGRNAANCALTMIRIKDHTVFQMSDLEHERIWTMSRIDVEVKYEFIVERVKNYIDWAKLMCEKMKLKKIELNEAIAPIFDIDWRKKKRVNKNLALIKEWTREIYLKSGGKSLYDLYFSLSNYYCNGKRLRVDKLEDDKRFQMAMIKRFYELYDYGKKMLNL